jgi:predicted CoA-binding protein
MDTIKAKMVQERLSMLASMVDFCRMDPILGMTEKNTFVLGASDNPDRTSFTALHMLRDAGVPVFAFGLRPATVAGVTIHTDLNAMDLPPIHTVTMYMGAVRQAPFLDFILGLSPSRIIFNPGSENPELVSQARKRGIECIQACTLVMLNFGQF